MKCPNCGQPAQEVSPDRCACEACGELVHVDHEWVPGEKQQPEPQPKPEEKPQPDPVVPTGKADPEPARKSAGVGLELHFWDGRSES